MLRNSLFYPFWSFLFAFCLKSLFWYFSQTFINFRQKMARHRVTYINIIQKGFEKIQNFV